MTGDDQAVLDALDEQAAPTCDADGPAHKADVALRCRACSHPILGCAYHVGGLAGRLLMSSLAQVLRGGIPTVRCLHCNVERETLDELVEVVTL